LAALWRRRYEEGESKRCFFEKKKQKTSTPQASAHGLYPVQLQQDQKFFGYFFSKK
jgi:hypothetical protein